MLLIRGLMAMAVRLNRNKLKSLGIKAKVIAIIVTWEQPWSDGHIKFERILSALNGKQLRQVLVCSSSSSDPNWARVVSRDFLKRELQKDEFLKRNSAPYE